MPMHIQNSGISDDEDNGGTGAKRKTLSRNKEGVCVSSISKANAQAYQREFCGSASKPSEPYKPLGSMQSPLYLRVKHVSNQYSTRSKNQRNRGGRMLVHSSNEGGEIGVTGINNRSGQDHVWDSDSFKRTSAALDASFSCMKKQHAVIAPAIYSDGTDSHAGSATSTRSPAGTNTEASRRQRIHDRLHLCMHHTPEFIRLMKGVHHSAQRVNSVRAGGACIGKAQDRSAVENAKWANLRIRQAERELEHESPEDVWGSGKDYGAGLAASERIMVKYTDTEGAASGISLPSERSAGSLPEAKQSIKSHIRGQNSIPGAGNKAGEVGFQKDGEQVGSCERTHPHKPFGRNMPYTMPRNSPSPQLNILPAHIQRPLYPVSGVKQQHKFRKGKRKGKVVTSTLLAQPTADGTAEAPSLHAEANAESGNINPQGGPKPKRTMRVAASAVRTTTMLQRRVTLKYANAATILGGKAEDSRQDHHHPHSAYSSASTHAHTQHNGLYSGGPVHSPQQPTQHARKTVLSRERRDNMNPRGPVFTRGLVPSPCSNSHSNHTHSELDFDSKLALLEVQLRKGWDVGPKARKVAAHSHHHGGRTFRAGTSRWAGGGRGTTFRASPSPSSHGHKTGQAVNSARMPTQVHHHQSRGPTQVSSDSSSGPGSGTHTTHADKSQAQAAHGTRPEDEDEEDEQQKDQLSKKLQAAHSHAIASQVRSITRCQKLTQQMAAFGRLQEEMRQDLQSELDVIDFERPKNLPEKFKAFDLNCSRTSGTSLGFDANMMQDLKAMHRIAEGSVRLQHQRNIAAAPWYGAITKQVKDMARVAGKPVKRAVIRFMQVLGRIIEEGHELTKELLYEIMQSGVLSVEEARDTDLQKTVHAVRLRALGVDIADYKKWLATHTDTKSETAAIPSRAILEQVLKEDSNKARDKRHAKLAGALRLCIAAKQVSQFRRTASLTTDTQTEADENAKLDDQVSKTLTTALLEARDKAKTQLETSEETISADHDVLRPNQEQNQHSEVK